MFDAVTSVSVSTSGTANIPAASTSGYGVTQLSSSTSSTSTTLAATASAVKSAYDLANTANTAASSAASAASAAQTTADAAMPKSGGQFTGSIYRNGQTTISSDTAYYRPIRVSTSAPTSSQGNVGDIWIQYV